MAEAAGTYTLLTVGDGLVSQIPALIISTAAGILISRSSSERKMGDEFARHIFAKDIPIYVGSVIVFMFGLVPGLPAFPFMSLSLALAGTVYFFKDSILAEETDLVEQEATAAAQAKEEAGPEDVEHLLSLDSMELEVGYGLIPLVDKSQDGTLLGRIRAIRRQFATEMGIIIPPIHIRDNLKLRPSEYRMLIKGTDIAGGELMISHLLAMDPGDVMQKIDGIPTTEPAFNLPALWIPPDREEDAKFAGYTVVDNSTVMATHITEIIRSNAAELLGRQEVQQLLSNLAKTSPKAVEELVPNVMSLGMIQKVLQNLLRERVSIRNLLGIVETLADYGPMSKDTDLLTEYVRQKLGRFILGPFIQPDGTLPVLTLSQNIEELIAKNIQQTEHGAYLAMDPAQAEKIIRSVRAEVEKIMMMNLQPILLSSPGIRRHLRKMIEQYVPSVMVISHAEIAPNISIKAVGKVSV
jgi:flagellar biosynthesis protein FlhA